MHTAVIGSRSFNNYPFLRQTLEKYPITQIISGGAKGADQLSEQYAHEKGLPTCIFKPDYAKFGKTAPLIRNQDIVNAADQVIAFWDGQSRGTAHALEHARKQGKIIYVVSFP